MSDTLTLRSGPLAVSFEMQADRYAHRIALWRDGTATPLAESVEGLPDDAWPASPALQQLQMEERARQNPLPKGEGDDHAVALLVGMAGHSHWSLGVEPAKDASARVQFDVACRVRATPASLVSSYRLLVPARLDAESGGVLLDASGGKFCLRVENVEGARARIELASAVLSIRPSIEVGKLPATVRWRYSIGDF